MFERRKRAWRKINSVIENNKGKDPLFGIQNLFFSISNNHTSFRLKDYIFFYFYNEYYINSISFNYKKLFVIIE